MVLNMNEQIVIWFFVGQAMKLMAGNGNPAMINKILKDKLDS